MDAEVRRLKNRIRQQRYRARKREEKAKNDASIDEGSCQNDHHGASSSEYFPILPMPNDENWIHVLKNDTSSIDAEPFKENNIRQTESSDAYVDEARGIADHGIGGTENCYEGYVPYPIEREQDSAHILDVEGVAEESHVDEHRAFITPEFSLPLSNKMEDGYHKNTFFIGGHSEGHDIMVRRLKNRERQRRYRARKRLGADGRNASLRNCPTCLQSGPHLGGVVVKLKSFVSQHRDWKKDAREAHAFKEQESAEIERPASAPTLASEPAAHGLHDLIKDLSSGVVFHSEDSVLLTDNEANDSVHKRRHWKAAARNKVDCSLQE